MTPATLPLAYPGAELTAAAGRVWVAPGRDRIYRLGNMTYTILPGNQPTIDHDPDTSLTYGIDFAGELATGDALTGTPTVTASGLTVDDATISGTDALARITGGTLGARHAVTFECGTEAGDTLQLTIYLRVVQR